MNAVATSEVVWIDVLPPHWKVLPLRSLAAPGRASFVDGDWIETPFITDEGIRLLQTGNIGAGQFKEQGFRFVSEETFVTLRCTEVEPGDVLICRLAEPVGRACLAPSLASRMITSVDVCIMKPSLENDARFIVYLLSSPDYLGFMEGQCRGGTRDRVSRSFLGSVRVPVPPPYEQTAIAAFLDHELGKIDALVEGQQRLIGLLNEKRQAIISHAVTKGIETNVRMKPSGLERLGDVPEHWKVARIKSVVGGIDQGWSPQCEGYPAADDEWGVLKVGCVNGGIFDPTENKLLPSELEGLPELSLRKGDVLVSRANTRELVGGAALITKDYPRLMICDKLYRLRTIPTVCLPEFLALFLRTPAARASIEIEATGASSSMLNIAQSTIREMALALPPVSEQAAIVTRTSRDTEMIDLLSSHASNAIQLLQERRSAMISAAVTGKIDVRVANDREDAA